MIIKLAKVGPKSSWNFGLVLGEKIAFVSKNSPNGEILPSLVTLVTGPFIQDVRGGQSEMDGIGVLSTTDHDW